MRLMGVSEKPKCGSTKGAANNTMTVNISAMSGFFMFIRGPRSLAACHAEESIGADHQHQRHRHEQHDICIAGIEHRRDADDLAGYEASKPRPRKRADAANNNDDKGLNEDRFTNVRRD